VKSFYDIPRIYRDISEDSIEIKNRLIDRFEMNLLYQHIPNAQQFSFHMDMVEENPHDKLILMYFVHVRKNFVMVISSDLIVDLLDAVIYIEEKTKFDD
jgi:hypothetical protein